MADTGWIVPPSTNAYGGWTNDAEARVEDGSTASCSITGSSGTETLYVYEFDLAGYLPAGYVLDGIEARIKRCASSSSSIRDDTVRLLTAGSMVGDNKKIYSYYGTSLAWSDTYGGPSDLWGTTTEFEHFSVGIGFRAWNGTSYSRIVYIDSIQLKFYYTPPPVTHDAIMFGTNF